MNGFTRFLMLTVLAAGSLIFTLWLAQPKFSASAQALDGTWQKVTLPWSFTDKPDERLFRLDYTKNYLSSDTLRVIPDDYLVAMSANGTPVSLKELPEGSRNNYLTGFTIGLGPWLKAGHAELEFRIHNNSGPGGLQFRHGINFIGIILIASAFAVMIVALSSFLPLSRGQHYILFLALLVLLAYWLATPWWVRTHDVNLFGGHMGYIKWIADHDALPRPYQGWSFYHPPLYYIAGAIIMRSADLIGIQAAECLQLFSLWLWLVFLVASAATLRRYLRGNERLLLLATTALAFWPVGILHSIRIGNDAPTYASCALATYYMICWWKSRRQSALLGMIAWSSVALLCKTSAIAMVAAGGALLVWHAITSKRENRLAAAKHAVYFGVSTGLALLLSLANNIYCYMHGELSGWLVGNVGKLPDALRVPANATAFLSLDVPTFLSQPWLDPWKDEAGRSYFWNYLLRNCLSGEFSFAGNIHRTIALIWGVCLLVVILLTAKKYGQILLNKTGTSAYRLRPILLLSGFWLAALIALRIQTPFAPSNDFRYILPILMPVMLVATLSGRVTQALLLVISQGSVCFFLAL